MASMIPFPVKGMIKLLGCIKDSMCKVVNEIRQQGAQVREEMQALVQKYMDLIGDCLQECMYYKNFTHISKEKLKSISETLDIVLNGKVKDLLKSLKLEKYENDFEKEDLEDIYQLMQAGSEFEYVGSLTPAARRKIQLNINSYCKSLKTVKAHIQDVEKEGKSCYESSKKITERFGTFLDEMKSTMEGIITMLNSKVTKETNTTVGNLISLGMASGGLVVCLVGVVGGSVNFFLQSSTPLQVPSAFTTALAGLSAAKGTTTKLAVAEGENEVARITKAIEELQKKLETMYTKGSKQKMAWREIETAAEKVVHYITTSKMTKAAKDLDPSQQSEGKLLLGGVQYVLKDLENLETNVAQFVTEAEKVQKSLKNMSLMKKSRTLAKPDDDAEKSCFAEVSEVIDEIIEAMAAEHAGSDGVPSTATSMEIE